MFMDFWCEIYESVKRKPSRTILTGIGISWGIFILIVLVGIGSGFERGVFKERLVEEKYNFKKKI